MHKDGKGPGRSEGEKYDMSGAGEEGYTTFCVGCEGSERNGKRHLRSPSCTIKSGWWGHRSRGEK